MMMGIIVDLCAMEVSLGGYAVAVFPSFLLPFPSLSFPSQPSIQLSSTEQALHECVVGKAGGSGGREWWSGVVVGSGGREWWSGVVVREWWSGVVVGEWWSGVVVGSGGEGVVVGSGGREWW